MNDLNVVVIGSGLSSIGAIRALVKRGIKPTVLDVGNILEDNKKELIKNLSSQNPVNWNKKDREALIKDNSICKEKSSIPKKLVFGSDFFYGKSNENAQVQSDGTMPPFSYSRGGLSAGWGAAILPPSKYDIEEWLIGKDEFHKYCKIVLEDLPYSSNDDGLSLSFPQMNNISNKLRLSSRATYILNKLKTNVKLKKDDTVYGQARLLVNSNEDNGCQYCGECMSGCVYKSIYKSDDDIVQLHNDGKINYIDNCLVDKFIEKDEKVIVEYFDKNSNKQRKEFDKVFLGAGAVNSSRIILNSLEKFDTILKVKTRGGYVVPVFSFRKLKIDWPSVNTQPSLFIEFRGDGLKHWVHTQVSSDNELLLKMLGLRNKSKGFMTKIKEFIASHTYLLLVNYHSEHSGTYELKLKENNILHTKHKKASPQFKVLVASWWKLFKILLKIGSIPVYPFAKLNSGSYHVGGTMPMKENPKELETDKLGVVNGMKNVHVVDTSTFPSLPGTTIGLMMMANAYRIVDQIFKKEVK